MSLSYLSEARALDKRPEGTLYIAAEIGCYSATYISTATVPLKAPKRIFRVPCNSKHHYEIFWAGKFKTPEGSLIPKSKESASFCLEKSKSLVLNQRNSSFYNYSSDETSGTGNWLPDRGPEAARYPKRLVCFIGVSTTNFLYLKEIDRPFVKGMQ